jgi:hypothetical protein
VTSHSARSSAADPLIGRLVENRYRVQQCIGRGGMGSVYLAEHVRIQRKVAIKVLHGAEAAAPGLVERFHREAVAAAAVGNEHVVSVTDMGQLDSGAFYIVLEYLEGADLAWRVANHGPFSLGSCLHIALQLCDALAAVHAAGIVHRDLKPENLFLCERAGDPEFLKVLDFGICKMQQDDQGLQRRLTGTGAALGTPHFMAPEQIEGCRDVDERADLYAVGGILYFMLAGYPPFDASSLPRLFMRISEETCPSLCSTRADVPPELDAIVRRALAKRPDERYASALELRSDLLPLIAAYPYQSAASSLPVHDAKSTLIQAGVGERAFDPVDRDNRSGYVTTQVGHSGRVPARAPRVAELSALPGKRRWPLRVAAGATVSLGLALAATGLDSHGTLAALTLVARPAATANAVPTIQTRGPTPTELQKPGDAARRSSVDERFAASEAASAVASSQTPLGVESPARDPSRKLAAAQPSSSRAVARWRNAPKTPPVVPANPSVAPEADVVGAAAATASTTTSTSEPAPPTSASAAEPEPAPTQPVADTLDYQPSTRRIIRMSKVVP